VAKLSAARVSMRVALRLRVGDDERIRRS
jgi:hypothetical protein